MALIAARPLLPSAVGGVQSPCREEPASADGVAGAAEGEEAAAVGVCDELGVFGHQSLYYRLGEDLVYVVCIR